MNKPNLKNTLFASIICSGLALTQVPIYAANECGAAIIAGTITCDGDSLPASDTNNYPNGIRYTIDGLTLNVNANATQIITNNGIGVLLNATVSTNPIIENLASTLVINTSGGLNHDGVMAKHDGAGAVTIISAAEIEAAGADGEGIVGWISNVTNSQSITINNSGKIVTLGTKASGVYAYHQGTGAINISSDADISTLGLYSDAVIGFIDNPISVAPVILNSVNGIIETSGNISPGISAYHSGSGNIEINSTAVINTTGSSSHGISANPYTGANTSEVVINVSGGSITTTNANADGIFSDSAGTGLYSIDVSNTTVNAGRFAVHSVGSGGGTIDISSNTTLGSVSDVAIRDGDQDGNGIDEAATLGNVVITTAGTINGKIIMGLGNDTLNFTGGSVTGNIYGDDTAETASDGDDVVNWTGGTLTGGIFTGNGSDTVTISSSEYTGVEILNGGDNLSIADGWIDVLTFKDIQADVDGTKISNWEQLVIDNSIIKFLAPVVQGTLVSNINGGAMNMQDGNAIDTLTVNGNYTGTAGSQIIIDSVLGDNSSATDTLTIQGDTSGTTQISINNLGGVGGATTGNGILLITVVGNSNGIFTLANSTNRAGDFVYDLVKIGNNWYLQSRYMPLSIPSLNQYGIALLLLLLLLISVNMRERKSFNRR